MKTKHIQSNALSIEVSRELRKLGTMQTYLRIVTCGKAVIILPDTNTSKDCELPELLKAMHCEEHKDEITKENYKTIIVNNRHREELYTLKISPVVDKFIDWCSENGFFDEGYVEFDPQTDETFTF